jgi:hypothetical protein
MSGEKVIWKANPELEQGAELLGHAIILEAAQMRGMRRRHAGMLKDVNGK